MADEGAAKVALATIDEPRSFRESQFASAVGDVAHLTALLDGDASLMSAKDDTMADSLTWAVRNSRNECVTLLLSRDADVESKSFGGLRPLHHACASYDEAIIRELIQKKADSNCTDDGGNTPLHYTSRRCVQRGAACRPSVPFCGALARGNLTAGTGANTHSSHLNPFIPPLSANSAAPRL